MDRRNLLYQNRFIRNPLDRRNTPRNNPNVLNQYNVYSQHARNPQHMAQHRRQSRERERSRAQSMFETQMRKSNELNEKQKYASSINQQLKRTSVSIDSAFRKQTPSFVEGTLFSRFINSNQIQIQELKINKINDDIQLQMTVQTLNLNPFQENQIIEELKHDFFVIIHNLTEFPVEHEIHTNDFFMGIPLKHLNYDPNIGYPIHKLVSYEIDDANNTKKLSFSLSSQMQNNGYGHLVFGQPAYDINDLNLTTVSVQQITDYSPGFRYPSFYSINLGYVFKNVVAVRLTSTVIPNTAFMINSSVNKNNKLSWVNESSKSRVSSSILYSKELFDSVTADLGIELGGENDNIHTFTASVSGQNKDFVLIQNGISKWNEIRESDKDNELTHMFSHELELNHQTDGVPIISEIVPIPEEKRTFTQTVSQYATHTITLKGGNYSSDDLATEIEKELNHELSTSNVFDLGFNKYSWKLSQFNSVTQRNDLFKFPDGHVPLIGRFFVDTDELKKIITISQCKTLYFNNVVTLNEFQIPQNQGPLYVNSGIPYLYVLDPGTLLQSGDTVRIENSFDIFNIKDSEINREHRIIVCSVWRYTISLTSTVVSHHEQPFLLYEIIGHEETGKIGRIIRFSRSDVSNQNIFVVDIEMIDSGTSNVSPFGDTDQLKCFTSNAQVSVSGTPEQVHNAHEGYYIKLSHVVNRTNLAGIGTEQLFIGQPIPFKFLFGKEESPREVLGFKSDLTGAEGNLSEIQCERSESNTIPIHDVDILDTVVLATCEDESAYSIQVRCVEQTLFTPGDHIYISHHQPLLNDREYMGFSFKKIEKNGSNQIVLYVDETSYLNEQNPYGPIPQNSRPFPFLKDENIYICNHETLQPVYEDKVYIITALDSVQYTYARGDEFILVHPTLGNLIGSVISTVFESKKVRVEFDINNISTNQAFNNVMVEKAVAERDGNRLYKKVGIPNNFYTIEEVSAVHKTLTISADWSVTKLDVGVLSYDESGFGRCLQPDVEITSVSGSGVISCGGLESGQTLFNPFVSQIVFIYPDGQQEKGQYYNTIPDPLHLASNQVKVHHTFESSVNGVVYNRIRVCTSATRTVLNDHNGFIVTSVDETKTKVTIKVPKDLFAAEIATENCHKVGLLKHLDLLDVLDYESTTTLPSNLLRTYGRGGKIFMREVDKPYTVEDEYMYLLCPTLKTVRTTEMSPLDNVFAKILLPGKSGQYVFNSFVSSPKIFDEFPLRELHTLQFHFVNQNGETFNFNELDHSLSLEIIESVERLDSLNVQMTK